MSSLNSRSQRACILCSIVLTTSQFLKSGCPNCEDLLQLRGSSDAVSELTSQVFEGLLCVGNPGRSWVAKWQRLSGYVPGVYAVKVVGRLPEEVVRGLEERGVRYVARDGSGEGEEEVGEA